MRIVLSYLLALFLLAVPVKAQRADTKDPPDKDDGKKDSYQHVGGKTLNEWLKDLKHTDPSQRRDAIQAVQLFKENHDATPVLVMILRSDLDSTLRSHAAIALMNVGIRPRDAKSAVDALAEQMEKNYQVPVRYYCAMALGRFGAEAKSALVPLVNATADQRSWEIRQVACSSLIRIFTDEDEKVPVDARALRALIIALNDPAGKVRQEALVSLLSLGPPTDRELKSLLVDKLIKMLGDREKFIVVWAYYGLMMNLGVNDKYLDALVGYLKKGDVPTKVQTIRALGMLGKEAKSKIQAIIEAVSDPDPMVAMTACSMLAAMNEKISTGQAAIDAVKKLMESKKADDPMRKYVKECYDVLTGEKKAIGKNDKR
jgi:HEAT repeat protein